MTAVAFSEILVVQDAEENEKDDHEQEEDNHSDRDPLSVKERGYLQLLDSALQGEEDQNSADEESGEGFLHEEIGVACVEDLHQTALQCRRGRV